MNNKPGAINRIDVKGRVNRVRGDGTIYSETHQVFISTLDPTDFEALRQIMYAATGDPVYLNQDPYKILRSFAEYASEQYQRYRGRIELVVGGRSIAELPKDYRDYNE